MRMISVSLSNEGSAINQVSDRIDALASGKGGQIEVHHDRFYFAALTDDLKDVLGDVPVVLLQASHRRIDRVCDARAGG